MGKSMTKRELIDELSERAFTTRKQTDAIIEALNEIVSREAVRGFSIPGLCKFEVVDRKARKGRNPQTGERIDIPASKGLRVRPLARVKRSAVAWIPTQEEAVDSKQTGTVQSFFIQCPHCQKKLEADSSMCGMVAECPYCENSMTVPQTETPEPYDKAAAASHADDGYVYFYCPTCRQAIEANSRDSGNRMQCPTCKAMAVIPESTELTPQEKEMSRKEMLGNTIRIEIP